jgi:hypothetical protein
MCSPCFTGENVTPDRIGNTSAKNRPHFQQIRRRDKCSSKPCSLEHCETEAGAEVDDGGEKSEIVAMKPSLPVCQGCAELRLGVPQLCLGVAGAGPGKPQAVD